MDTTLRWQHLHCNYRFFPSFLSSVKLCSTFFTSLFYLSARLFIIVLRIPLLFVVDCHRGYECVVTEILHTSSCTRHCRNNAPSSCIIQYHFILSHIILYHIAPYCSISWLLSGCIGKEKIPKILRFRQTVHDPLLRLSLHITGK